MIKSCVFCGKYPEAKNMEHIIPQWLIKETGDPKRIVPLGLIWKSKKLRKYSFNQLRFPACSGCNNKFSILEERTKTVVTDMLNENPLSGKSFDIFLTWLDKIRIGLWLGYRYLDGDMWGISPKFHIKQRISNKDRMVIIFKTDDSQKGINFMLVNTPFYAHYPSCLALAINQFYFVNVSTDFLLSRRLGLPFPAKKMIADYDPNLTVLDMHEGLERILMPLIRSSYNTNCTEIYQPIIPKEVKNRLKENIYQTPYVRRFFKHSRIGKPLIKISDKEIINYPVKKTNKWIPCKTFPRNWAKYIAVRTVLIIQNYLASEMPSTELIIDDQKKKYYDEEFKMINISNKMLLHKIDKELKPK